MNEGIPGRMSILKPTLRCPVEWRRITQFTWGCKMFLSLAKNTQTLSAGKRFIKYEVYHYNQQSIKGTERFVRCNLLMINSFRVEDISPTSVFGVSHSLVCKISFHFYTLLMLSLLNGWMLDCRGQLSRRAGWTKQGRVKKKKEKAWYITVQYYKCKMSDF